jgi:hypothetical protein
LLDNAASEKLNAVRLARAPVEEEKTTPETAASPGRVRASLAGGEGIPREEILREFGLSQ